MVNKRIRAIRDETSARLVWKESEPDVPVAGLLVGSVLATLQAKIVDVSSESASCSPFSSLNPTLRTQGRRRSSESASSETSRHE